MQLDDVMTSPESSKYFVPSRRLKKSWFTWYLIHFSTHFSYSPEASFGGEAVGNAVGEESLSHEHHGLVEVALLSVESWCNSFASTEPVG